MGTIREGKVEVVDAVRARLDESSAAVVTEYRGLTVAEMAALRKAIRTVGGDFKVFKNTLVRRAITGSSHEPLTELLEGPTAIAFVAGDVSAVAKALRDFARGAPALIIKGGVLDGSLLGAKELGALADLPSRDVLLSMFAGALAAPMRTMAGLLKAVPQNFAYGLSALLESKGGAPAPVAEAVADAPAAEADAAAPETPDDAGTEHAAPAEDATTADEAPADAADEAAPETGADEASADETTADEAPADETAADETTPETTTEEPAAE
jgi:large subunit ribosomal protein L10